MKTVLFGLDGATFTVLDYMIAEGLMPNLARFREEGASCELRSTPLPITPQAWTTLATGRGAGAHGMHDFIRCEFTESGIHFRVNSSLDVHVETIWSMVSRSGRRASVFNYYGTAPAQEINGQCIPGFVPARHLRRQSYPADLFDTLKTIDGLDIKQLGLNTQFEKLGLQKMEPEHWGPWINHHIEREQAWFKVLEHHMREDPSDLTAIVFDGVDKIQHLAYRFVDPAYIPAKPEPWEAAVIQQCREYFKQVDEFLGRTIDILGPWGRIFIASDHGFTATTQIFYANKWLHEQGYLHWRGETAEDDKESIFVENLGDLVNSIDLEKTKAFALTPSSNGIYINVEEDEYESFRDELIAKLRTVQGVDGKPLITDAKKREEWWPGPLMERIPDLTLEMSDYGLLSAVNARAAVIGREHPAGTHHPNGVLLAGGLGIKAGARTEARDIVDVASMLMHSLGMDIPADFEGEVPESFYDAEFLKSDPPRIAEEEEYLEYAEETEGEEAPEEEDNALLMDRLKSLGYIE